MTDKELLELAAKAAGMFVKKNFYGIDDEDQFVGLKVKPSKEASKYLTECWNPLTDDGDALRLAVKLNLIVDIGGGYAEARCPEFDPEPKAMEYFNNNDDPFAATRRAIVRAASEIGRGME